MKRAFVLSVAFLLAANLIGCGGAVETDTSPDAEQTETVSGETAEENPAAITEAAEGITDYEALLEALGDESATSAHISADMTIAPEEASTFEREGFVLTVDEGVTVTMDDNFCMVFWGSEDTPGLVVNGTLIVTGSMDFGEITLMNSGMLEIASGGVLCPGMSTILNDGTLLIDAGGELRLERGSGLQNRGVLINNGTLNITDDGGSLTNDAGASIENNGHIAFDGDYQNSGDYTGAEAEPASGD